MKRMLLSLLLIVAALISNSVVYAQSKMVITMNDGKTHEYPVKDVAKMSWEEDDPNGDSSDDKPQTNNHDYVDLGLPSGTLWATCNVGANSPEEYGDYFAWGETKPKKLYGWSNYKHCNGSNVTLTKYCISDSHGIVDKKARLELEDDAAHVNWGGDWRMPTVDEMNELCNENYCSQSWTTHNGINGYMITSKSNGNSIFLPAAHFRRQSESPSIDNVGYYWTSTLYTDEVYGTKNYTSVNLHFYKDYNSRAFHTSYVNRCNGLTIRPVLDYVQN